MRDPALERMRRDMKAHSLRAPRIALRGAWESMHGGKGIRHKTGATRRSATASAGAIKFRQVRRGPQYPPRGSGESDRATRSYRHGQPLNITTQHPGGLLARGIFRAEGFHAVADRAARKRFQAWKWKLGEGR